MAPVVVCGSPSVVLFVADPSARPGTTPYPKERDNPMIAGLFEPPAALLAWFYSITHNYIIAISMIALVVMLITAPLVLKSTKGMLEMQKLQPEMRKLQQEHRGDRQKLNEEMMKLYQEHKVNPMASCFPLLLQMPVFIIMYQVLAGLTHGNGCPATGVHAPIRVYELRVVSKSLVGKNEMLSWGLDLAKRPIEVIGESFGKGLIYAMIVVALGVLYFVQQKMVAARAQVAPNMSETQAKLMQYLPVVFAVFLVFYLTGLVIYYMAQAIFRIGLQYYITHKFYKGEHSLGRQAQVAGEQAREIAKKDGGGGGLFAQAKRELSAAKETRPKKANRRPTVSKRVTPPKNRPTPTGQQRSPGLDRQSGAAQRHSSQEEVGSTWNGLNSPHAPSKRPRSWPWIGWASPPTMLSSRWWPNRSQALFGRLRGEARVRARVRPAQARQKVDRRDRRSARAKTATARPKAAEAEAGSRWCIEPRRRRSASRRVQSQPAPRNRIATESTSNRQQRSNKT